MKTSIIMDIRFDLLLVEGIFFKPYWRIIANGNSPSNVPIEKNKIVNNPPGMP